MSGDDRMLGLLQSSMEKGRALGEAGRAQTAAVGQLTRQLQLADEGVLAALERTGATLLALEGRLARLEGEVADHLTQARGTLEKLQAEQAEEGERHARAEAEADGALAELRRLREVTMADLRRESARARDQLARVTAVAEAVAGAASQTAAGVRTRTEQARGELVRWRTNLTAALAETRRRTRAW